MKSNIRYFFLLFTLLVTVASSQNESNKWYFGNQAGLDFNTNPPTILTNGVINTMEGCASISNAAGSLLFYTDGTTIYNQAHVVMANGNGLTGNSSTTQSGIIVKQPGSSTLYFVFTLGAGGNGNLSYSIVDMSLAAGMGSVTTKNVSLSTGMGEKLTSVKHCNGVDFWVLAHENNSNNFKCYLVTSLGVNTVPVITGIGSVHTNANVYWCGNMKISPNGKKIGMALSGTNGAFELYDFDNSTGVVTNSLQLGTFTYPYGCEFSPDGTKFFGDRELGTNSLALYQWDLCAGSPTAIIASQYTIAVTSQITGMQLAKNGKIYIARVNSTDLAVINNPNVMGIGCNYVHAGQSIAPKTSRYNPPNFITSFLKPSPPPFTYTANSSFGCQAAGFNAPFTVQTFTLFNCSSSGYSLTSMLWNFGDPTSGVNNTSTLSNPIHAFTTLGTFPVQLVLYYSCGGGTDTLNLNVTITQPCISVSSTSITCASLGSATVVSSGGVGPYTYTWNPTGQTNSVAVGLMPGTYTLTVHDQGNNFTYTATTLFTSLIPLSGNLNTSSSITCNGASTGTANVTNISGGSNNSTNLSYLWSNGTTTITTPTVNSLSAGLWSVTVSDNLTGCQINQSFFISQPPAMTLNLSSSSPTGCATSSLTISGVNSGGTPFITGPSYTYSWSLGPTTASQVVSQFNPGNYIYTLTSRDANNCEISNTIPIDFITNPVLSLSNVSICPQEAGFLNVSGASTYTWNNNTTGNALMDSPLSSQQYSVIGSALGCTSAASAYIILKPVPFPIFSSNSPVCEGKNLNFSGYGGASYSWSGPSGYSSNQNSPVINAAIPSQSGVYSLTVTAGNSCTASTTKTITVNPTPTLSALGSTICVLQPITLTANSSATSFTWSGPSFNAILQNPVIANATLTNSGNYTVKVSSAFGCTNSAIAHVTVTAMPNPVFTSNSPVCSGSTLSFTASGGDAYSWSGPNGFNPASQNPTLNNVTIPAAGVYTLQVTKGPCINTISHPVVINPLPSFTLSSNTPCENNGLYLNTLAVTNATSYAWAGPSGFTSTLSSPSIASSSITNGGIYSLQVTDLNSCQDTKTLSVKINDNPILLPVSATVCVKESATLQVSGAHTYLWSGPLFYQSTQANAVIQNANNPALTVYTVIGTGTNLCTSTAQASLTTLALPLPSLNVFPSATLCSGETFTLQGFGGSSYDWYSQDNLHYSGKLVSITARNTLFTGTYTLVVTDTNGCKSSTTKYLNVDPLPNGYVTGKMKSCIPFYSNFEFVASGGIDSLIVSSWTLNEKTYKGGNFTAPFASAGNYSATGILTNTLTSCSNTVNFVVEAYPLPLADFDYTPKLPIEEEDVIFTNTSKGEEQTKWSWFFKTSQVDNSENEHAVFSYKKSDIYAVALVVKNKWGCSDTVVKSVQVKEDLTIYIPNAFTPNGDDLNELFLPVMRGIKFYKMEIFNRWGDKLFESNDLSTGWPGEFKGQACPVDVYTWKINYSSINGDSKTLTGHVFLNR